MARAGRWQLGKSLGLSLLLHGALFGGALGYVRWQESRLDRAMEIDLRGQSLLARPQNLQGGPSAVRPPEPWILASGKAFAPPPKAALSPTAQAQEAAGPACPPPCPANPGDWVPASAVSRIPDGYQDLFSESDYPAELLRSGRSGHAEVEFLVDGGGNIRQVEVLSISHASLQAVLMRRLMGARVRPAYDANGEPVPCRMRVPIDFVLQ